MSLMRYRNRRACALDNGLLQLVVTAEGGHLAAVTDLATGLNPLWAPPWETMEPSAYSLQGHPEYGSDAESKLLSGILGHNLCLDVFGGPSEAEGAAGMTVHGEAPVVEHGLRVTGDTLCQEAWLPEARLRFERSICLPAGRRVATVVERVENTGTHDRPVAWTEHVTLGPPFLEKGRTQFRATATRGKVLDHDFTGGKGHLKPGAEFTWPWAPCVGGGAEDLQVFTQRPVSGAFTTQLMDPQRDEAWFLAWNPTHGLAFGYAWKPADFPWLGIWEENYCRADPPWNGVTLTRGLEFGVSPFPESRRAMIDRGSLFGVPAYRWIPAGRKVEVAYRLFLVPADAMPEQPPEGA